MKTERLNLLDVLVFFIFLVSEFGTLGLPLNLYQFVFVALLIAEVVLVFLTSKKTLFINSKLLLLFLYIVIITLINGNLFNSFTKIAFFFIELVGFYIYSKNTNLNKIFTLLIFIGIVFSIVSFIQELGYFFKIPKLYDYSFFGFKNGVIIRSGILAVSSLCAEPSHCAPFVAIPLFVCLSRINNSKKKFKYIFLSVVFVAFGFLTQSLIVYVSIAVDFIVFLFYFNRNKKIRNWFLFGGAIAFALTLVFFQNYIITALSRLSQFENAAGDNINTLSAASLLSNYGIAVLKMKDGYVLGTGFSTHALYYDTYIGKIYSTMLVKLNMDDAGSMYIRIFSEFGIIGLSIFILFVIFTFFSLHRKQNRLLASLVIIFSFLIVRNGGYQDPYSVLLFILLFILPKKQCKESYNRLRTIRSSNNMLLNN